MRCSTYRFWPDRLPRRERRAAAMRCQTAGDGTIHQRDVEEARGQNLEFCAIWRWMRRCVIAAEGAEVASSSVQRGDNPRVVVMTATSNRPMRLNACVLPVLEHWHPQTGTSRIGPPVDLFLWEVDICRRIVAIASPRTTIVNLWGV